MAISQSQKVDFLYKKLGFTKTKTGLSVDGTLSGTKKAGFGEVFASPLVIADGAVWNQSELIPTTPPGSDTSIVKGYRVATALRMTVDPTTAGRRSYIAYTTFNNTSSARLTNWIDTQFGNDYVVKVYAGDPNSGGTLLPAGGSTGSDSWFFDYSAGILQFHDTSIHSSIDSNGTNVYIVGYRYIGQTGVISIGDDTNFGDLTVNNNFRVVGLSTFVDAVNLSNNLSVAGITTLAGLSTVTGHTLFTRQLSVSGVSTFNGASKFQDDVTFYGANAGRNVVWDKSDNRLEFAQDAIASFGNNDDLQILNNGSISQIRHLSVSALHIQNTGGRDIFYEARNHYFRNQTDSNELQAEFLANGAANLYHDGGIRFETTGIGVSVLAGTGNTATIAGPQFLILDPDGVGVNTGVVRIKGDLIVEGEQTVIKSTELEIADFIVGIASTATTDALADGAGFKIGPNNTLLYEHNSGTNPSLKSSENLNVATGKVYQIAETERLSASKLSLGTGTTIHAVGTNILSIGTGVAERVRISDDGINVVGISTFSSSIDANGNLDVAGISTFGGNIDANGIIEGIAGENKIPSLYANFSNLPNASSYHGLFAHVHATQKGYFAHGGAWYELVNRKLDGTVGTGTDSYNVGIITATGADINGNIDVSGTSVFNDDVTFFGSSNLNYIKWDKSANTLDIRDNIPIRWGSSNDFLIQHTSNHTQLFNSTGAIVIRNQAQDSDISIEGNDGGTNITMLGFDASESGNATFSGDIKLTDGKKVKLGAADDLTLSHRFINNSWNGVINNATNVLFIESDNITFRGKGSTESLASFVKDGPIHLYYDNTLRFSTSGIGVTIAGEADVNGDLNVSGVSTFQDDVKLTGASYSVLWDKSENALEFDTDARVTFGDSKELKLYHSGGNSTIQNTQGQLSINNDGSHINILTDENIYLKTNGTEHALIARANGEVELFHDAELRMETTGYGVTVFGTTETQKLNVTGISTVVGVGTFKDDVYIDKKLYVSGIEIGGPGGPGIGTDITTRNLKVTGIATVTGNTDLNGNLDVAGTSVFNDDVTFTTTNSKNIVFDKDANDLTFGDNVIARFGDSNDLSLYHDSSSSNIIDSYGALNIKSNVLTQRASDNSRYIEAKNASFVKLFYAGNEKLATSGVGATVFGELDVTGPADIEGNLTVGVGGTTITTVVGAAASVGIGDASPSYMLDVAGAINSQTDVKVNGVSVSDQALNDAVAMAIALG